MTLRTFLFPLSASLLLSIPLIATSEPLPRGHWVQGQDPLQVQWVDEQGVQRGTFRRDTRLWYPYDAKTQTWAEGRTPPWVLEGREEIQNYGVYRYQGDRERWIKDGKEVIFKGQEGSVKDSPQGPDDLIPDDVSLPWLVWVGDEASGRKIESDFLTSPALSTWKGSFRFQSYPSDGEKSTMIRDRDGKLCYLPGLTAVSPDRQVLWNLKAAPASPEELAGYLRKLDPNFNPLVVPNLPDVPDPNSPSPDPLSGTPGSLAVPARAASRRSLLGALFLFRKPS